MNSPKRKLRRDSSTSSVIVMDLDKSYRHDVSVSRNQQEEQDVVSPIEKLKRRYLQENNNKGDSNDGNTIMVLDGNDNDNDDN